MKIPTKFIKTLSEEEITKLVENYQTNENFRVRNRSHAILLSFEGYPIDEIAVICKAHRNAVSRWLERWKESGFDGLADGSRSGRPKLLSDIEEARAVEIALSNPRFPARQGGAITAALGKEISRWKIKDLIKKRLYLEKNQVRIVEADR